MAMVKGTAIQARMDYLRSRFGPDGLAKVLDSLAPEHRSLVTKPILVSNWYPMELSDEIMGAAEEHLGKGDGSLCRDIGVLSCKVGLQTVYKAFSRPDDPSSAVTRLTGLLWKSYYDTGEMVGRVRGPDSAEILISGIQLRKPWLCHLLVGFIATILEEWGGSHSRASHPECMARGDSRCLFLVEWR